MINCSFHLVYCVSLPTLLLTLRAQVLVSTHVYVCMCMSIYIFIYLVCLGSVLLRESQLNMDSDDE